MITKMEVFSAQASAPELQLGGFLASDDPVQIRDIDGLGPVKAELTSAALATGRGEFYQGSSIGKRNIVLTLGLNPNWETQTISSLRQLLYAYFMPESWTKLRFYSDDLPPVDSEGIVESFEPNIFSQDPEVQVSIICHQPDFIEADATLISDTLVEGLVDVEFDYRGTLPTGFEVKIESTDANPSYTGDFMIINRAPIVAQHAFFVGVVVDTAKYFKLTTVKNARKVQNVAVPGGAVTNLLSKMSSSSQWPELKPGENTFSITADEAGQAWTLAYYNRYGGL